jgi:hypothetical protein
MSARVCPDAARVLAAVRLSLSEEGSSSSSLPSLSSELKAHLSACAVCAAQAAALDPNVLFASLAASVSPEPASTGRRPAPPVAEDARRVADAVLEEVRRRARVTPPAASSPSASWWRTHRLAQAAALLALTAGLAGLVRWERARVEPSSTIAASSGTTGAAPAPVEAPARPLIEGVRNPNARVYEFASASPREPAVVFVANPNADL